jgi:hypothetical protein
MRRSFGGSQQCGRTNAKYGPFQWPSAIAHCDYNHYYGPLDFTYVRQGLFMIDRKKPTRDHMKCEPEIVRAAPAPSSQAEPACADRRRMTLMRAQEMQR